MAAALSVEGLWKQYTVGAGYDGGVTLYDSLSRLLKFGRGGPRAGTEQFWALQDLGFEVQHGEVVGVIGRNGAGKSTLLKVLSRITAPTRGRAIVRGRMASLLEVGTGFHPELTGRENIYLNGAILGMKRADIDRQFDAIVAFAEIDRFVDTPVKRYSSGMYVRLAFSVAAHLDPDILLVDEVLAVGDAAFQKRCMGKMHDVATAGRTVIFVSHNMGAIMQLCSKAIVLDRGRCVFQGATAEAIGHYVGSMQTAAAQALFEPQPGKPVQVRSLAVRTGSADAGALTTADEIELHIEYDVRQWPSGSYVCVDVYNEQDLPILWSCDVQSADELERVRAAGRHAASVTIPRRTLNPGRYFVSVAVYSPGSGAVHDVRDRAICIEVLDGGSPLAGLGVTNPSLTGVVLPWTHAHGDAP